jgi:tetratricopeptide (TPR) repeat protein
LRPEAYHPLPAGDIPEAFRGQAQPSQNLEELLRNNQFRAAAIRAVQLLTTSTSPDDSRAIFELLYVRLACLTLCGLTEIAAMEIKMLEDLNSAVYFDDDAKSVIPWELRVLAVRLQGLGYNDVRRGIMGYYELARDARNELARLKEKAEVHEDFKSRETEAGIALWTARLRDLGMRVAGALVEMEDYEGAATHLRSLAEAAPDQHEQSRFATDKALLWLRIGDVDAAREAVKSCSNDEIQTEAVLAALADTCEGKYDIAATKWKSLLEKERNEMWQNNLAVCLLYSGRVLEVYMSSVP